MGHYTTVQGAQDDISDKGVHGDTIDMELKLDHTKDVMLTDTQLGERS